MLYSNWNFYNFTDGSVLSEPVRIKRGDIIKAGALFDITEVKYANATLITPTNKIILNSNSKDYSNLFSIQNISIYKYWVNFTINTSNIEIYKTPGIYDILIKAVNRLDGYNETTKKTFHLYGFSKISEISINDSYLYPSQTALISCKVVDKDTGEPISGYPVEFYINDSEIARVNTDKNGIASISYEFQNEGDYLVRCNISDEEDLYYYASEENSKESIIKVFNLSAEITLNKTYVKYGESIRISVNITNASKIVSAKANISYKKIENYELINTSEEIELNFNACYEPYFCNYYLEYKPKRSGEYEVTIEIDAESPFGIYKNTTYFNVSFGEAIVNITFPNFEKILFNQTFKIKINISSINGDIWFGNISLESLNESVIKLLENSYKEKLYSISIEKPLEIEFLVKSENFGNVNINASIIPLYGEGNFSIKEYEVINFESYILNENINFGNEQKYFANITGNTSEIKRVYAAITFFNISNCKLSRETIELDFKLEEFDPNNNYYYYSLYFVPPRSGNYSSIIFVETENGTAFNTTQEYYVSFGRADVFVINPYYFILPNQTFYTTIGISAIDGDLWFVNTSISISNTDAIDLDSNESENHANSIEAIPNGTYCIDKWKTISKYKEGKEVTTITFSAFPQNGSSINYSESFEVILPLKPYFNPNITFIDEYTHFIVPIFGNASEFYIRAIVNKPDNIIEEISFSSFNKKRYDECGITIETGNIAPKGIANASDNNDMAMNSIDNDLNTAWYNLDNRPSRLNISFVDRIFTINKILITWQGPSDQDVYANISYINHLNNHILLAENLKINSSKTTVSINIETPIKVKEIIVNISGIGVIYEIEVFAVEPRTDYCYEFYFNFTNFTRSGYYNVEFFAITEFEDEIEFGNSNFFVNYGIPLIFVDTENGTHPAMLSGQTQNYTIRVKAYKGDLKNLTLTFISENTSFINITEDESYEKFVESILWKEENVTSWKIYATMPIEEENITIQTYVNSTCEFCFSNSSINFSITIYPFDLEPPNIEDFLFIIKDKNSTVFNVNDSLIIRAIVTDNIYVTKVIAEIIYPDETKINASLQRVEDTLWEFKFSEDKIQINKTGDYYVKIYAYDLNQSQFNSSEQKSFAVFDYYFIDYTPQFYLYNFGEEISFFATDVNGFIVDNVEWIESNYNISNKTTYFKIFLDNRSFDVGLINLNVSATKNGNKGLKSINITLSNILYIDILSPPQNYVFDIGVPITGPGLLPAIKVLNVRRDKTIENAYSEIACFNENYNYTIFNSSSFYYNACGLLNEFYSFKDCASQCYAPNLPAQVFNISFYVKDYFGNEGYSYAILRTKQLTQESAISPGFGGIGAGGMPIIKQCECTQWQDVGCRKGICKLNQLYQVRSCKPANCDVEERCIESILCTPTEIDFLLSSEEVSIHQGETKIIAAVLKNTGKKPAKIKIILNSTCCIISSSESEFEINVNEIKTITFFISARLNESLGEQKIDINVFDISEEKGIISKSVKIFVSLSNLIQEKEKVKYQLEMLRSYINELDRYGLLSEEIKNIWKSNEEIIESIPKLIEENNVREFENAIVTLKNNLEKIKDYVENKKLQLLFAKHRNEILISIFSSIVSAYVITQIIIPYIKISKEIRKLLVEEDVLIKQRKEIQKQFFMRKVSEEMFRKMITETQNKILEVKSKIKTLNEEKNRLILERSNPKYFMKIVSNVIKKLIRKNQ
ncbi:MAG: hypothetical protein QXT38_00795 [Candidatus Aenigmatarchaeota archaeon]